MTEISQARLDELLRTERKMQALEAGGVDNWEHYGLALEEFRKVEEREEAIRDMVDNAIQALTESAYEPSERGAGWATTEDGEREAARILRDGINAFID